MRFCSNNSTVLFDFSLLEHLHKFPLMMNLNMFHVDLEITKRLVLRALSLIQTNFDHKFKKIFLNKYNSQSN